MTETPQDHLKKSLEKYQLQIDPQCIDPICQYCYWLWEKNKNINLTRHLDFDTFVARDLHDTMQLSSLIPDGWDVLDVGTGGGVPGIVLGILRPDLNLVLCESIGKKARIVQQFVERLKLPATVIAGRAESILDDFRFHTAVSRAVGPLWKICHWFKDNWIDITQMLAIKGPKWTEERQEARHKGYLTELDLRCVLTYPLLGTDSQSYILKLSPKIHE